MEKGWLDLVLRDAIVTAQIVIADKPALAR